MILTFFRANFKKLPHKNIENLDDFLHALYFELSKRTIYNFS